MQRWIGGHCFAIWTMLAFSGSSDLFADGPSDNMAANVRPIPPVGLELSPDAQKALQTLVIQIDDAVAQATSASDAAKAEVAVFSRAISLAANHQTIYSEDDIKHAKRLSELALSRAKNLPNLLNKELEASKSQPRLIVGGFRSKLDDSIQPYGLVIPASLNPDNQKPLRLDVWLHGRGENVCELQFLHQRSQQAGEITPEDTIVLHPFGRYCNAFKFAGEIDILEVIEHVKSLLPIDENRINIRGFSMGGAGVWQMAVHYPDLWMAATPGAGFCETQQFLASFQQEVFKPTTYQSKLLHWYDCPEWGNNLRLLPTIAYSGELDKQKQAADLMESTLRERGIALTHIIGPQTAHKIHPESKEEIERRLQVLSVKGRESMPREIDFTTFTLRYAKNAWVSIEGLNEHWKEARVQAKINDEITEEEPSVTVTTQNVSRLTLGPFPLLRGGQAQTLIIDSQKFAIDQLAQPATVSLARSKDRWTVLSSGNQAKSSATLRKRPGLQGPIDDAFMSAFVVVTPEQTAAPNQVDRWASTELQHFVKHWLLQFRGTAETKASNTLSDQDKQMKNLILFGTPQSNPLIAEVMKRLPIKWDSKAITRGEVTHDAGICALAAIYPSPFAKDRYVVINSGFTFREYAYLNNARQIAMLPDWAVIDVTEDATTQTPGKIIEADFFDESWQLK